MLALPAASTPGGHKEGIMATTPAVGSGPVEFMDESTGQQLSIPLSDLAFDANGNLIPSGWPLYQQHKATVDSVLKYLQTTGAIYPAPSPPPAPAMVIEAKQQGSSGNNIQIEFSKVGTTDPNDPTKFDAKVTETEAYNGLTKDTDLGTAFAYEITVSPPPGAAAPGVPANGVVSLRGGAEVAAATTAKAVVTGES